MKESPVFWPFDDIQPPLGVESPLYLAMTEPLVFWHSDAIQPPLDVVFPCIVKESPVTWPFDAIQPPLVESPFLSRYDRAPGIFGILKPFSPHLLISPVL